MGLRYQLCKVLTFLRMHPLDCEHCNVYWSCAGQRMRTRLQDLRRQETQDATFTWLNTNPGIGAPRIEAATQDRLKTAESGSRIFAKRADRFEALIRARDAQKKDLA